MITDTPADVGDSVIVHTSADCRLESATPYDSIMVNKDVVASSH